MESFTQIHGKIIVLDIHRVFFLIDGIIVDCI